MNNCVLCGTPLNKNNPDEHIIHNALGGVLKDNGIYCESCNSKYGTCLDKDFTSIFDPIMAELNIHKDRKSAGSPYCGVVRGDDGQLYRAKYKGNRITTLFSTDGKYVDPKSVHCSPLLYEFNLNNHAFKRGLAKIAFNYAIHCGLKPEWLECVFDNEKNELISRPVVIPFIPLTLFDAVIEQKPPESLFHALRIFNCGQMLYAYVELFGVFQQYVLLSEEYDYLGMGNIDCSDGNLIEQKKIPDEQFLEDVTPRDYKDATVVALQYGIDLNKHEDENKRLDADYFRRIGKSIYESERKQPYIVPYNTLVNKQYNRVRFRDYVPGSELFQSLIVFGHTPVETESPLGRAGQLFSEFQFYTIYEDDCVNMSRYKRLLPDGSNYPLSILRILASGQDIHEYGYMKFHNLAAGGD